MKVSAIQLRIKWEDPAANIEAAGGLIEEAVSAGCDMAALPELFSTGVTLDPKRFQQGVDGEVCAFLSETAKLYGIYLVGSFIEESGGGFPKNTLVAYDRNGTLICRYSKNNLFRYGGEHKAYSCGKDRSSFAACEFKVAPYICYDLRFPDLFKKSSEEGANLFVVAANWPDPRKDHWVTLLKARAIENHAYVMGVNNVGKSPKNAFFGASMIVSPHGTVLSDGGGNECVVSADVDLEKLVEYRRKFNPCD